MRLAVRFFVALALVLGLARFLALTSSLAAQVPGPQVTVATRAGDVVNARLRQLSDTTVVLDVGGQRVQLPIADLRYISFVGPLGPTPSSSAASPAASSAVTTQAAEPTGAKPAREQCAAKTQKGTRCSRLAEPGSAYCWQHKK